MKKRIGWIFMLIFSLLTIIVVSYKREPKHHTETIQKKKILYTCSMHPQIIREEPGDCPICGMQLVPKGTGDVSKKDVTLGELLQQTNQYVVSQIPMATLQYVDTPVFADAPGIVEYDGRFDKVIASRVEGRIEKLYIDHNYQSVKAGDPIMDIYSPELQTAEQNLLMLLNNDVNNTVLIDAAQQRLSLLGVTESQISTIKRTKKLIPTIRMITDKNGIVVLPDNTNSNMNSNYMTKDLPFKEGSYVAKGQTIVRVVNPNKKWLALRIDPKDAFHVRKGMPVAVRAETQAQTSEKLTIDFVEPLQRDGSDFIVARVYVNDANRFPVGTNVKASIPIASEKKQWLPVSAVLALGNSYVVFRKEKDGFRAHAVTIGYKTNDRVEIKSGIALSDSVAGNAQYLVDSDSFIASTNH